MKIKKGDNIIVISGKDKGKTGKITKSLPKEGRIVVEGVNVRKVHERPKKSGQKGQIVERSMPIDASNVMIADPKTNKPSRIGKKLVGEKFVRISKKSGTELK